MGAVWMLVRSELRRRWPTAAVLTLLVGVAGGAALTAVAGARRTGSSFDRFEAESRSAQVEVNAERDPAILDEVERLPQVETLGRLAVFFLSPPGGRIDTAYLLDPVTFFASVDGELGTTVDRPRILSGRLPDPEAVDEVVVNEATAASLDLEAGDRLELWSFGAGGESRRGPDVALTVVGIGVLPSELAGGPEGLRKYALLTPAFYFRYRDQIGNFEGIARARLRGGPAALPAFTDAVQDIYGGVGGEQFFDAVEAETAGVDDSIDVLAVGLLLFAAATALAGAAAAGLALGRQTFAAADDGPVLRALGLTPGQRFAVLLAPGALAAFGGAVLAVGVAVAASPLMPIGIARRAEPDRGLSVGAASLASGFAAVVLVVLALAALAAWRARRLAPGPATGGTWSAKVTHRLARAGLGPAPVTGVRLALVPGRGKTAVPVRAALFGTAVGLAGIVAVVVFGASVDRLLDTSARYGWNWDVTVDVPSAAENRRVDERDFADDLVLQPEVGALAVSYGVAMDVEGHPVGATGLEPLKGAIEPEVLEGEAPRGPTEAVLGTDTLERLGREVGDRVEVTGAAGTQTVDIVGRGVLPTSPVADGISLTVEGYERLNGDRTSHDQQLLLVRWAPGVDGAAATTRLERRAEEDLIAGVPVVAGPTPPAEVKKLDQVDALPRVLAGFLALLAALAVAHALVTSVRRRRRDFAILETLGFVRRQVSAAVAWQATTITVIGLLVGIPLGLLVGRSAWALVADGIGVATDPAVPVPLLLLLVPVTLLVANAVAVPPAFAAARIRPATVLRSE